MSYTLVAWLGSVIVLSGCIAPPQLVSEQNSTTILRPDCSSVPQIGSTSREKDSVSSLLDYVERVRQWPAKVQQREFHQLEQSFVRERSPEQQLQLALLLILPNTQFLDETRSRKLLQELPKDSLSQGYQGLTKFLLALLDEREAHRKAYEQLKRMWENEQQERKTLQKQLNALKALEKNINERDKSEVLPLEDVNQTKNPAGR